MIFKLIDPRGNFCIDTNYGDYRYDIAKLRHCYHGRYDEIKNNLSSCLTYVKDIIKDVKNSKLFILCDSMLCFDENIVYMNGDAY